MPDVAHCSCMLVVLSLNSIPHTIDPPFPLAPHRYSHRHTSTALHQGPPCITGFMHELCREASMSYRTPGPSHTMSLHARRPSSSRMWSKATSGACVRQEVEMDRLALAWLGCFFPFFSLWLRKKTHLRFLPPWPTQARARARFEFTLRGRLCGLVR